MFSHTFNHMTYIKSDTNTTDKKLIQWIKKILFHPKHQHDIHDHMTLISLLNVVSFHLE